MGMTDRLLLTSSEVARRLGVKPATVYAYVSRGVLRRHPGSTHRRSLFDATEVEAVAGRARHQNRSSALEVVIETQLTSLQADGHLHFRGRDAVELARYRSFEAVAGLLWDGDPHAPWELDQAAAALIESLMAALPAAAGTLELIPLSVAALAITDPERGDRQPEAVRRAGARILAGVLTSLACDEHGHDRSAGDGADRSAAARLWVALDPAGRRPPPAELAVLNAALVLLADHELAASTLAARVAASAWADPYRVVLTGLGPLGGALHGGASLGAEALLAGSASPAEAFAALERGVVAGMVPGFGHRVYRDRDPRADHLLERLATLGGSGQRLSTVTDVLAAARALNLPAPNADFALAASVHVMGLRAGSAATIFTVARLAGLLAHAIEEYPYRLRFRPRASYVGEAPRRTLGHTRGQ